MRTKTFGQPQSANNFRAKEQGNAKDAFTVAVLKYGVIISQIPRKISAACSMFLRLDPVVAGLMVSHKRPFSSGSASTGLNHPCRE